MVREAYENELQEILELYLHLHETSVPDSAPSPLSTWKQILNDPNHHLIVYETGGQLVSSCVCVIIPNLTRNARPYALIENVVTREGYRGKGYASACLDYAKHLAEAGNCYKMMLLTSSKSEETLSFYKKAGYNCTDKTAFIQWLGRQE